jgi:hypothetical protein
VLTTLASIISAISRGQICERVERGKETLALAVERNRAHGAPIGAKRPADL